MSGDKIFKEIKDAIKARIPDRLTFHDVEQAEFDQVMHRLRLPKNYFEEHAFRIHWFPREKYLKVIIPSELHESPSGWVFDEIQDGLITGIIPPAWVRKIFISPSPTYNNFLGEYTGYVKEADLTFVPLLGPDWTQKRKFPSIVLESGWTELADRLALDTRLWQQGTEGAVRVVIQVKYYKRSAGRIGSRVRISRATPTRHSFKITNEKYEVLPPPVPPKAGPSITFGEFFAGGCPKGMNPKGSIILNLENLRVIARREIIARGDVPDEGDVPDKGGDSSVQDEGSEGSVPDEGSEASVTDEGGESSVQDEGGEGSVTDEDGESSVQDEGTEGSVSDDGSVADKGSVRDEVSVQDE